MLDNEPTTTDTTGFETTGSDDTGSDTTGAHASQEPVRRTRRRATSPGTADAAPAEAPIATTAAPTTAARKRVRRTAAKAAPAEAAPAKAAAKAAPRKAAARKSAAAEAGPATTDAAAAQAATGESPQDAAPTKSVTKRTTTRKATTARPADTTPVAAEPTTADGVPAGERTAAPPARRTRKAAASAAAITPDEAAPAVDGPVAPARKTARTSSRKGAKSTPDAVVTETTSETTSAGDVAPLPFTGPVGAEPAGPPARRTRSRSTAQRAPEPAPAVTDEEPGEDASGTSAAADRRPPVAPAVMFMPPSATAVEPAPARRRRRTADDVPEEAVDDASAGTPDAEGRPARKRTPRKRAAGPADTAGPAEAAGADPAAEDGAGRDDAAPQQESAGVDADAAQDTDSEAGDGDRRRRRRGRRGRGRSRSDGDGDAETGDEGSRQSAAADSGDDGPDAAASAPSQPSAAGEEGADDGEDADGEGSSTRRRRRRRRRGDEPDTASTAPATRTRPSDEVQGVRGSTRLEAKRQRRRDDRDSGRRRAPILSEAEFLARREAVDRVMAVRQLGDRTQIAVLEDSILVEHYVTKASSTSFAGNVYLGRVQNVLPSMEAAFVDIGKGRNAVLYAGEVNWDAAGLAGKSRSIETALKSGDRVLVQVSKDPIGQKGARLTSQVSLPGRYLVYVPNGSMTGISRKLPDVERQRLKEILRRIVPEGAGVIIRTAAEGASEEELTRDVDRLKAQWEVIKDRSESSGATAPALLYEEPDLAIRVVRDVFNEDFTSLAVSGDEVWDTLGAYVEHVAPDLAPRLRKHTAKGDLFHEMRVDEQLLKALDRKVYLPSGGSLVIDRTEAMTVVDVNTGKFIGSGGNLEQTVTRNNLEAAEEIVRQLRLRDIGGIIVIDFIDMVLENNRDLVLRRLTECLGRDRTKHQVAEVTSLGLVQMTRKRVGQGLLEAFSETCEVCHGRGLIVHSEPVEIGGGGSGGGSTGGQGRSERRGKGGSGGAGGGSGNGNGAGSPAVRDPGAPGPHTVAAATRGPAAGSAPLEESASGVSADGSQVAADSVVPGVSPTEPAQPAPRRRRGSSRGAVTVAPAPEAAVAPSVAPPETADASSAPAALASPAAGPGPGPEPVVKAPAVEAPAVAPEPVVDAASVDPEPPAPPVRRRRAASRPAGPPGAKA